MLDRSRLRLSAVAALLAAVQIPSVSVSAAGGDLQVVKASVVVECPLTVGGRFEARTRELTGSLALIAGSNQLSGALVVDLRRLDTGIELRNRHLRDNYLEVSRGDAFAGATLTGLVVRANDLASFQGRAPFHGLLTLHGTRRDVAGVVEIRRRADAVEITADFPIGIADFKIPKPTYLGVGVSNQIRVVVTATLRPAAG